MLTRKQQRALSLSILVTAGLYLFFVYSSDTDKILNAIQQITLTDWVLILLCSFANYVIRFIRWNSYVRALQHNIPLKRHFAYYLAGLALTTTPAKAGETIRSLYLQPYQVKISESLACFFSERLLDVTVMVLFASLIFITFPGLESRYTYFIVSLQLLIIVMLPLLSTSLPQLLLQWLIDRLHPGKITTLITQLKFLLHSACQLLKIKMLTKGLLLGVLAWLLNALVFYLILQNVGFPLALPLALSIYAVSILAGAASFIPGGIGATETVMALLLLAINSEPHIAIAVPIMTRLATLWFAVVVGLLANAYLSINKEAIKQTGT